MKTLLPRLLFATLAVALLSPACQLHKPHKPISQTRVLPPPVGLAVEAPDTVVYWTDNLPSAMRWYQENLGFELVLDTTPGRRYPFASKAVGVVVVYLTTDPRYRGLQPIYYWQVADLAAVEQLRLRLETSRPGSVIAQPPVSSEPVDDLPTISTRRLEITDPYGNKIGVINNPIYPPKLQLNKNKK